MKLRCSRCGKVLSTEVPEGTIVRAFIECPECIEKEPSWEKEFEDRVIDWDDKVLLVKINSYLIDLIIKYRLINNKVKIKCKDGCIQIERSK